jgi:hypothetical protein
MNNHPITLPVSVNIYGRHIIKIDELLLLLLLLLVFIICYDRSLKLDWDSTSSCSQLISNGVK